MVPPYFAIHSLKPDNARYVKNYYFHLYSSKTCSNSLTLSLHQPESLLKQYYPTISFHCFENNIVLLKINVNNKCKYFTFSPMNNRIPQIQINVQKEELNEFFHSIHRDFSHRVQWSSQGDFFRNYSYTFLIASHFLRLLLILNPTLISHLIFHSPLFSIYLPAVFLVVLHLHFVMIYRVR